MQRDKALIEYIISTNPDDRAMRKTSRILCEGGIIAFPTDTNWIIAACPFSKKGVEKLYKIKGIERRKNLSFICNSISQACEYAIIPDHAYKIMRRRIPGPYTLIFEPTKKIPRTIKEHRKEKQIGIRIPKSNLCKSIIEMHGNPLVTTSIRQELIDLEEGEDIYGYLIDDKLQLDLILDPGEVDILGESSVINFVENIPELIREGIGDTSFVQ